MIRLITLVLMGCMGGYPVTPPVAAEATRSTPGGCVWPVSTHLLVSAGAPCDGEVVETGYGQARVRVRSGGLCILDVPAEVTGLRLSNSQPPKREVLWYLSSTGTRVSRHRLSNPWVVGGSGAPVVALGWAGFGEVERGLTWSGVSGVVLGPAPDGGTEFAPISELKRLLADHGEAWTPEPGQDPSIDLGGHAWPQ